MRVTLLLATAWSFATGCRPGGGGTGQPRPSAELAGREWVLVELAGRAAPPGAGDRPATLRFDSPAGRVVGFAGCNQFGGGYALAGDSLRLTDLTSTLMACDSGMELERDYTAALEATRRYRLAEGRLVLLDSTGVVARFEAR